MTPMRVLLSLAAGVLMCGAASAQPPKAGALNVEYKPFSDGDLQQVAAPEKVEVLTMRGQAGYGTSTVTDAGMAQIARFKNLRVLAAGGLGLTDRALAAIGKLDQLEELSVDSNKITGEGLKHLTRLKKLRKLNLNFNPLQRDSLAVLPKLPGLTDLQLYGCPLAADDALFRQVSALTQLMHLQLPENCTGLTDRGLAHLTRLQQLKNLTLIRSKGVTDVGLLRLAALQQLQNLELRELPAVTPRGMEVLGKLTALRRLQIVSVALDNAALRSLAPLKEVQDLLIWSVASEPINLDVLGDLTALRYFRTNQTVSSSAIRALAKLDYLESITDELYEITDEDLKFLARSPKLRVLVLGSEHVMAAALPSLAKMKALRDLYVTEKVRLSPAQLTALGAGSLPACRISRFRPPYTVFHRPQ